MVPWKNFTFVISRVQRKRKFWLSNSRSKSILPAGSLRVFPSNRRCRIHPLQPRTHFPFDSYIPVFRGLQAQTLRARLPGARVSMPSLRLLPRFRRFCDCLSSPWARPARQSERHPSVFSPAASLRIIPALSRGGEVQSRGDAFLQRGELRRWEHLLHF